MRFLYVCMEGKKVLMALFIFAAAFMVVGCAEPADTQPLPQEEPGEPVGEPLPQDNGNQPLPGGEPIPEDGPV